MARTEPSGASFLFLALLICFFVSGAAALIYEVVWMRMLTQIFGSSAHAVATVLAAFMAGLALGSYVFGRLTDQARNFLRLYALLELGIGVYGFLVPIVFRMAQGVYVPLFWLYDSYPVIFNSVLFLLSFVLLVIPTFLMGATLPVLSRFFVRSFTHLGQRVGDLYGTNTLGAVLGCGVAGYALIPNLGMKWSIYIAATLNVAIALVILFLDSLREKEGETSAAATGDEAIAGSSPSWVGWLLLFAIGISGAAAMVYENAWTHALTLVIGGSVYSFTTMLLTFLTGLALGGYLYARLLGKREVQVTLFGLIELGVGIAALATIPLFEKLPLLFIRLHDGFGHSFSLFLAIQVALSFAVMFLPTLLLGMTFPLTVRLFTQSLYRIGSSVGTTYASNTIGAIAGAFVGGFIFLPLLGIQKSIIIGALLNLAIGWLLLVGDPHPGRTQRVLVGGVAALALALLGLRLPSWDRSILTSGVTIYAESFTNLPRDSLRLEEMRKDKILYYREGLTATISVHQAQKDYLYLKSNGKIDGSHGDALTMFLTGYIPMLLVPQAEQVMIIGLGTAMTVKAVGAFPVKRIEVLEIEPAMVQAAAFFEDQNGKILSDPRVRVIPTDGRNYAMATPQLYDIIISQPSNPWIAGIASLFTKEFYAVARNKLKPQGIFAQWIHTYSMSPDDFRMVLRTFGESFSHLTVWNLQESDFLLLGSLTEKSFDYPRLKKIFSQNRTVREDLEGLGLSDVYALLGFYRMGRKELLALAEGAEINTDDSARLEFSAPRSLGRSTSELNQKIMEPYVTESPWGRSNQWVSRAQHHYYFAQAFKASGWYERALPEIEEALRLDPRNPDYHLVRAQILLGQDDASEAARALEKALDYGPHRARKVLALTDELYTKQAEALYSRIITLGTREILPYVGLGTIALHRRELQDAEKWFRRAEKIQPEHPAVLLALGRLELAKGNYARAVHLLEQSKEKGEDSATLYSELGLAHSKLNEWGKAAQALELSLRRHRGNVRWRLVLAQALEQLRRVKEAEERYREVLALSPANDDAWKGLRRLGKSY